MTDLDTSILRAIEGTSGQTAGQIAGSLGVDRQVANWGLYGRLKGKVQQDKAYRWYVKGGFGIEKREDKAPSASTRHWPSSVGTTSIVSATMTLAALAGSRRRCTVSLARSNQRSC